MEKNNKKREAAAAAAEQPATAAAADLDATAVADAPGGRAAATVTNQLDKQPTESAPTDTASITDQPEPNASEPLTSTAAKSVLIADVQCTAGGRTAGASAATEQRPADTRQSIAVGQLDFASRFAVQSAAGPKSAIAKSISIDHT